MCNFYGYCCDAYNSTQSEPEEVTGTHTGTVIAHKDCQCAHGFKSLNLLEFIGLFDGTGQSG